MEARGETVEVGRDRGSGGGLATYSGSEIGIPPGADFTLALLAVKGISDQSGGVV